MTIETRTAEQAWDEEIAPLVTIVADLCEMYGIVLIAHAEIGERGITHTVLGDGTSERTVLAARILLGGHHIGDVRGAPAGKLH